MSRLGTSLSLTAGAALIFYPLAHLVKVAFRHPIIAAACLGLMGLILLADDVFNITTVDAPSILGSTEEEIAQDHTALYCENNGYVICAYDDMKVTFVDGRAQAMAINARSFLFREYANSEDFYRYTLERSGFPYQEPTYADMNMIVWENIGGVSRVTLTSSDYMSPKEMFIER